MELFWLEEEFATDSIHPEEIITKTSTSGWMRTEAEANAISNPCPNQTPAGAQAGIGI